MNELVETIKMYEEKAKIIIFVGPWRLQPNRGCVDLCSDTENIETDSFSDIFRKGGVETKKKEHKF